MPLRTYESSSIDGVRRIEKRISRTPFPLSARDARRMLGVSDETIAEAAHWSPGTFFDDSVLRNLAYQVTEGPIYGWKEPGKRTLTTDNRTGNTRYVFRAEDGTYRTMILSGIVNNQSQV